MCEGLNVCPFFANPIWLDLVNILLVFCKLTFLETFFVRIGVAEDYLISSLVSLKILLHPLLYIPIFEHLVLVENLTLLLVEVNGGVEWAD